MKQFILFAAVFIVMLLVMRNWPVRDPGLPDDEWFRQSVVDRSELVLVKFGAEWCGYCVAMEEPLQELQASHQGRVHVVQVDTEERPAIAHHYGVEAIPRTLLFRDGKVVADRAGFMNAAQLKQWVDGYK